MRRNFNLTLRTVPFLVGALFILTPLSFSETEIKVSGQVRVRTEVEKKSFVGLDTLIYNWAEMRTRLGVVATIDSNITAFIQIQDSKVFGADGTSGTTTGSDNVDLHQAYIQIDHLWKNGIGIKAGRFEFNLGNERIFGAADWDSVGRSWEGVSVDCKKMGLELTAFVFSRVANNKINNYRNHFINGLQLGISKIDAQLFAFYESDSSFLRQQIQVSFQQFKRYNIGMYSNYNSAGLYLNCNAVYQNGDNNYGLSNLPIIIKENYSAFMFAFEVGVLIDSLKNTRIAGGIDYSSGDGNSSDDKINYFINPYYTGHKFRGYMDYFLSSATYGLVDLYLKGKIDPIRGWTTACDIHYFTAAADYTDFRGNRTKDIGAEIDFTVNTSRISGVGLQAGASIFFPTESYAGWTNPRPGLWGYTMLTANF